MVTNKKALNLKKMILFFRHGKFSFGSKNSLFLIRFNGEKN